MGNWTDIVPADSVILLGYQGSLAHGTYVEGHIDDVDLLAVVVPGVEHYFGLRHWERQGTRVTQRGKWDVTMHELRKFVRLCAKGNPNVLGLLWLNEDDYLYSTAAGQALIDYRDLFATKAAYRSFAGYASGQLHRMTRAENKYQGYMGAKRKALVDKYGYDCYMESETEFLTDAGWKRFDHVTQDTRLATVVPETGLLQFRHALAKVDRFHSGSVYVIEPYSSRAVVTPAHNMLMSRCHRSPKNAFSCRYMPGEAAWRLVSMQSVLDSRYSHYHIRRCPEPQQRDYAISNIYLSLTGLFLSDGIMQFRDGRVKNLRLTQSKPGPFHDAANQLMAQFTGHRYDYEKETIWTFPRALSERLFRDCGHAREKHLPTWAFQLSADQALIVWNSLVLGDGTKKKHGDTLYNSNERLIDDIQAMMTSAGLMCTKYGPFFSAGHFGGAWMYHLYHPSASQSIHTLNIGRFLQDGRQRKGKEGYPVREEIVTDERVVCFTVSNGTLVTRSNGKVAIHGNCKNASHLIRLLLMGEEFLRTGYLRVKRPDADMLMAIKRGEWSLAQVKEAVEGLFRLTRLARDESPLPDKPDMDAINQLCVRVVTQALDEREATK